MMTEGERPTLWPSPTRRRPNLQYRPGSSDQVRSRTRIKGDENSTFCAQLFGGQRAGFFRLRERYHGLLSVKDRPNPETGPHPGRTAEVRPIRNWSGLGKNRSRCPHARTALNLTSDLRPLTLASLEIPALLLLRCLPARCRADDRPPPQFH